MAPEKKETSIRPLDEEELEGISGGFNGSCSARCAICGKSFAYSGSTEPLYCDNCSVLYYRLENFIKTGM